MTTFDQTLPLVQQVFTARCHEVAAIGEMVVNRDLNGRVRLIVPKAVRQDSLALQAVQTLSRDLSEKLGCHGYPADLAVLFEGNLDAVRAGASVFFLDGFPNVFVIERLATDGDWASIEPESKGAPRIVFFSIKGGVGRSTALAASAWALAQEGKRVLVLDLDLESPGLSSSLLPLERRPAYGIADWLVEDLVDNGDAVFDDLVATSLLSRDGEIYVVPAHGKDSGEYVAKLGRVWMSKSKTGEGRETWPRRLARFLDALESRLNPDVILIDSRAGIDDVAASCITGLGASLVLLFAVDGEQTWSGYRALLRHWNRAHKAFDIRDRLQVVGAMIPDDEGRSAYFNGLRERSWSAFVDELYDEVPPGESTAGRFNFDEGDESAPHFPWPVRWNRGFAALYSLHTRFSTVDAQEVTAVFGPLVEGMHMVIAEGRNND